MLAECLLELPDNDLPWPHDVEMTSCDYYDVMCLLIGHAVPKQKYLGIYKS